MTKRKLSASSSTTTSMDKHALFTEWAKARGVEINGVKPDRIPGRGVGLVATKPLKKGQRVLFVPFKAMFTPLTASLTREGVDHASPQAQLAISAMLAWNDPLMNEFNFHIWSDTWPTRADFQQSMPLYWPEDMQKQLPPSAQQPLERQLSDYHKDWSIAQKLCARHHFSEEDFKYYWMIVNSRSFAWKPPKSAHGGFMVMCPFIDYINHGPTDTTCRVTMTARGYEVDANRDYEPGEEILATYSSHSNDKLLIHYGFICADIPDGPSVDDDIRLDHLIIPQLSPEVRDRLQDTGFLGAYALVPSSNDICFKTQVAVRAVLATCNEWEYFVVSGEDLTMDRTAEVNEWLRPLLEEYREIARRSCDAPGMLGQRWRQIVDAIDRFLAKQLRTVKR